MAICPNHAFSNSTGPREGKTRRMTARRPAPRQSILAAQHTAHGTQDQPVESVPPDSQHERRGIPQPLPLRQDGMRALAQRYRRDLEVVDDREGLAQTRPEIVRIGVGPEDHGPRGNPAPVGLDDPSFAVAAERVCAVTPVDMRAPALKAARASPLT